MIKTVTNLFLITTIFCFSFLSLAQETKSKNPIYDLFIKTDDSWKMVVKELTVTHDFQTNDLDKLPGKYFHGALLTNELEGREPGPVVFHVNFPSRGEFVFFLQTVSDTGILRVKLDKKVLKIFKFYTGPEGKGPWTESRRLRNGVYQCDYNQEYRVGIPAGKHDIEVQNMGTDWLSIGYFVFTKYSKKIINPDYEKWKSYKPTLNIINARLKIYENSAAFIYAKEPDDINYNIIPTLKLQLENFRKLAKNHSSVDFNLLRTESELKEILSYAKSNKDYFKTKRGRIKIGYLSDIDNTYQPYDVLIPENYNPLKKHSLIILLHGYQNEIQKYSNFIGENRKPIPDSLNIITVAVYGRRNHYYRGAAEEDVLKVLNEVQSIYSIDPDKIYLLGSSMGGYGTWKIGLNYPDMFAALSPVCAPSIYQGTKFLKSVSPVEYIENAEKLLSRIYHGAADSTVNVNNSRQMVEKLKGMKYPYVYTEFPNVGHDSWNNADADSNRLPWLLQYKRTYYPMSVRHKAFYLRYGKAFWLEITGKKNWNDFSEIQGEITGESEIKISTKNISSFRIDLRHPALDPNNSLKVHIDNDSTMLYAVPEGMDFYLSDSTKWLKGTQSENNKTKRKNSEGPFIAAETDKFIIAYGTARPEKIVLLKKIGTMLQKDYLSSDMEIKLVPDTAVIRSKIDDTHNLYLIGSPEENYYLKEILPGLPLSFTKDSMQLNGTYDRQYTGIQMIYPNPRQPNRYVIIDKYPDFVEEADQIVNFPVADYLIYSLKDGKFAVLKDEYFGADWQVVK